MVDSHQQEACVAALIVYHQQKKHFIFPLDSGQVSMGRSGTNDLILSGDAVSRRHAVIVKRGPDFWLEDKSSQGTMVNGNRVVSSVKLEEGCKIAIQDWELEFANKSPSVSDDPSRQTQLTRLLREQRPDNTRVLEFDPPHTARIWRARLVVRDAGRGQFDVLIKKTPLTVGIAADCDVVLKDAYVSKHHLSLRLSDRGFHITDLNSTNGTFLGNSRIREAYLTESEEIRLGNSSILVSLEAKSNESLKPFPEREFCGIYGASLAMRLLFARIGKVAETNMTALILGETGSGKEMVARAVHDLSVRRGQAFVVINCGAISAGLIESELFGHEKGAFTGAEKQHRGVFEQAHGGTVFLDEIGELPPDMQAKILRVLEYQSFRRVGGTGDVRVDVRVVAATHRDLGRMVQENRFREDLFYRLHVLPLCVPSLRERQEDIEPLVKLFIKKFFPNKQITVNSEAVQKLKTHVWPGNVRELKNVIMRALVFCENQILAADDISFIHLLVRPFPPTAKPALPGRKHLSDQELEARRQKKLEFEKQRIKTVINQTKGDKVMAAKLLGMGRSTLFRKVKNLGLDT